MCTNARSSVAVYLLATAGPIICSADKVGCVFSMVIVSILPHAEFGPNDHREDAPYFRIGVLKNDFISFPE